MIFIFLVIAAGLGTAIYLMVMYSSIPGAVDERLGELEPLPQTLGQWITDTDSDDAKRAKDSGLERQVRILHSPAKGLFTKEQLITQVRYKNAQTGEIDRVDPEVRAPRRRKKS